MTRSLSAAVLVAATLAAGVTLNAQKTTQVHPGKGGSPHILTEWVIDGANLSIQYGRPYLRGRSDNDVMPHGREWRTGADEPTTLKTDKPLTFGTLSLPAGTYTLNTMPGEPWQLIVLKSGQNWGIPYPADQEIGRTTMNVSKTPQPVEQLTISIDDTPAGATLRIEWGNTSATVPFTIG